jgi:hypothetical protein
MSDPENKPYLDGVRERAEAIVKDPLGEGVAGPVVQALTPSGRERLKQLFNIGGGNDRGGVGW